MNNALVIMKMTFRLLYRKGTLLAVFAVIGIVSSGVFYLAKGDGDLLSELEIRISYSYGMGYSILSLIVIAMACFTVRSQIDAKNMHLVTSMPIERRWIFTGQALALILVAFLAEIVLVGSVALNSYLYSRDFSEDERKLAATKYLIAHKKVTPIYTPKRELTLAYAEKNEVQVDKLDGIEWYRLYREALKEEQLIEPGKSLVWHFDLEETPTGSDTVELLYTFQKADFREKVKGTFELAAVGYNVYHKQEIEAHQFSEQKIEIPIGNIPPNGKFMIKFTNTGPQSTIVTRTGMFINYSKESLAGSLIKGILSQSFHLSVTAVVGLCAGIGLTFSVATFMVMMLFLMSSSQGLFELIMEDFGFTPVLTFWDNFAIVILNASMWATKGLQAPSIVGSISSGQYIEWSYLLTSWLPTAAFYGLFAYLLGSYMLSRKELDKVLT